LVIDWAQINKKSHSEVRDDGQVHVTLREKNNHVNELKCEAEKKLDEAQNVGDVSFMENIRVVHHVLHDHHSFHEFSINTEVHGNAGNELGEKELHWRGLRGVAALLVHDLLDNASTKDELEDEHELRLVQKFRELLVIDLVGVDVFLDETEDGEGEEILLQWQVLGVLLEILVHFADLFSLSLNLFLDILIGHVEQSVVDICRFLILGLLLDKFGGTSKLVLFALEVVEEAGEEEIHKEAWNSDNLNLEPQVNSWWWIVLLSMGEELPVSLVHEPICEEAEIAQGDSNKKNILDFDVQSLLCLTIVVAGDDNINNDQLENVSQDHGSNGNLLIIIQILGITQLFLSEIGEHKDRVKKIWTKKAELDKFEFHKGQEILLRRLLVEDSGLLLLSLHLLGNTGFVPEAVEMGECSDDDEDDTEVNLSDEKVLLKSNPFTDWGPL